MRLPISLILFYRQSKLSAIFVNNLRELLNDCFRTKHESFTGFSSFVDAVILSPGSYWNIGHTMQQLSRLLSPAELFRCYLTLRMHANQCVNTINPFVPIQNTNDQNTTVNSHANKVGTESKLCEKVQSYGYLQQDLRLTLQISQQLYLHSVSIMLYPTC